MAMLAGGFRSFKAKPTLKILLFIQTWNQQGLEPLLRPENGFPTLRGSDYMDRGLSMHNSGTHRIVPARPSFRPSFLSPVPRRERIGISP